MGRLVVEKGKDKGKSIVLRENTICLVGRDLKTSLRLRDLQASRRHLKITCKIGGELRLEDLDSSNGTFVNGERIRTKELVSGDKIQIGETLIFYLEDESQDDTEPPPIGPSTEPALAAAPVVAPSSVERIRRGELTGREVGGYRIGRLLGRGGMGTVYEALQVSLERSVAFKVLAAELAADGQFVDRFTAEARAAGRLNHPNIVQVYDVGFSDNVRFYSMEYMKRGSIEDLLRREGRLGIERALPIIFDAARGLEYAERHGVVHRDIKPDNLMMSEDEVVKIGDLGIATRRKAEGDAQTEEGVSGSPHYIAPEQAMGRAFDHRADLYALGVSIYQMLSGDTPFEGASAREVILKHLNQPAPPLAQKVPGLAPEITSLVERLMEKDPAKRLPSASVLLQELVPLARRFPLKDAQRLRIDGVIAQRTELQISLPPAGAPPPAPQTGPLVSSLASAPLEGVRSPATSDRRPLPDTTPRAAPTPGPSTAVAASTPPVGAETAAAAIAPTEAGARPRQPVVTRASLVRALVVLASLVLGVFAFAVVKRVREGAAHAHLARLDQLDAARALLAKDATGCEKQARSLAALFRLDGDLDAAEKSEALANEAARKVAAEEEQDRLARAEAAFGAARATLEKTEKTPDDPEGVGRLDQAVKLFEAVAHDFEGTRVADEAGREALAAREALARARETQRARVELEEKARRSVAARNAAVNAALERGHFGEARDLVEAFEKQFSSVELARKGAAAMRDTIAERGRAAIERAWREAEPLVAKKRFSEATTLLRSLKAELAGIPDLGEAVDVRLKQIADTKLRIESDAASARRAQDEEKAREADANATKAAAERRFAEAVSSCDAALDWIETPDVAKPLKARRERFAWAGSAVERICALVREKREQSGLVHVIPFDNGPLTVVATEVVGTTTVRFRCFERGHPESPYEVSLASLTPANLVEWAVKAAHGKPDGLLDATALALEVDARELARKALQSARELELDAAQKTRATRLFSDLGGTEK